MQISLLTSLLVLPSLLLAADVKHIICPDGSSCPIGQACRSVESTGRFHCDTLPQEELDNKKLFVGLASPSYSNTSSNALASSNHQPFCPATMCYGMYCCQPTAGNIKRAACCIGGIGCCPERHQCCADYNSHRWCCPQRSLCASTYFYCIGGAGNLSPATAMISLLFSLLISKYVFLEDK